MSSIIDFTGFRTVFDHVTGVSVRQTDVLLVDFETGLVSTDTLETCYSVGGY